jgi:acetylornithine/succinyldiaminopimelate/putrescine aminotransferase
VPGGHRLVPRQDPGRAVADRTRHHAEGFGPLAPGFDHVPFGDAAALESPSAARRLPRRRLFLEPIQGEGGVILPPPGLPARARALCDRHGVALVSTRSRPGSGAPGASSPARRRAWRPIVLLLAKALGGGLFPLGACLVAEAWWDERFALGHSSTFANNNVACAVGRAVLRALTEGGLCAAAAARGQRLGAGLRRLRARYPRVIADVRGRGLLWAIELAPAEERSSLLLGYLQHQGLYAYAAAGVLAAHSSVLVLPTLGTTNVLRVAPPLVITDEQVDLVLDGVESLAAQLHRNPAETVVRALGLGSPGRRPPPPRCRPPPPLPATPGRRRWAFLSTTPAPRTCG